MEGCARWLSSDEIDGLAECDAHLRRLLEKASAVLGPDLGGLLRYSGRGEDARQAVANLMNNVTAIQQWYCSSFVVACYEVAREMRGFQTPVIDVDFRFVSPKTTGISCGI
jgi:hypothetical protein